VNEKPLRKKGRTFLPYNPKPTKAQLLAEPVTHHLYFKADQDFKRERMIYRDPNAHTLHKILVQVCTPRVRVLKYQETLGKLVVLDCNKSILSANFNPSKFDFNPYDKELGGPTISFRLYTKQLFQVSKGDRLGCAAMIPTVGVPNWKDDNQVQQKYKGDDMQRQRWPSML